MTVAIALVGFATSFVIASFAFAGPAQAEGLPAGARVAFIERWEVERLDRILTEDTPTFASVDVTYSPAQNAVDLYRITYPSVIPERGARPTVASGLIAIPITGAMRVRG